VEEVVSIFDDYLQQYVIPLLQEDRKARVKYFKHCWGNPHWPGQIYPDIGSHNPLENFGPGFNHLLFPEMTKCLFVFQEGDEYLGEVTVTNDHSQSM
jgi:hypothetical protein